MAVVINEFEVISEPPAPAAPNPAAQPPVNPLPPPTAHDVAQVIRRQVERQARVWAH